MATELATEFRGPGAQGSHLLLFAGVETNVYCIPCSVVRKCTSICVAPSLSLSGVVWRFCRLLCSVAFAILCQFTVCVMDYWLPALIAKMGERRLAMQALCRDHRTAMLCSHGRDTSAL